MPYEIDFLPVGRGDRSGDAIAVRYGTPGNYTVVVYDGGTRESGEALVRLVLEHYGTDFVDHVVNSHPDGDHASGLAVVLEHLNVGTLWMHRPWNYSSVILDYFHDGRITSDSLRQRLQTKMRAAYELESIAIRKGILIREPFQGEWIGKFHVLSPSREVYVHELVPSFEKSPALKTADSATSQLSLGLLKSLMEVAKSATRWVAETLHIELLREGVETSAENESSAILYGYMEELLGGIVLTGDAGIQALTAAAEYLERNGLHPPSCVKFIQVPHHGSRHNVSPSVLDRLLGPKITSMPAETRTAYVSAGAESTTHPRKMVINAFMRRGFDVIPTRGDYKCHSWGMPPRAGWSPVTPLAFSEQVEDWGS
jgi:beta-lactamase superfamily II metal-dependent hydrolase